MAVCALLCQLVEAPAPRMSLRTAASVCVCVPDHPALKAFKGLQVPLGFSRSSPPALVSPLFERQSVPPAPRCRRSPNCMDAVRVCTCRHMLRCPSVRLCRLRTRAQVRHPGVTTIMHRDFVLMERAAKMASAIPGISELRLDESIRQFGGPLKEQLDLAVEAGNLLRFRWARTRARVCISMCVCVCVRVCECECECLRGLVDSCMRPRACTCICAHMVCWHGGRELQRRACQQRWSVWVSLGGGMQVGRREMPAQSVCLRAQQALPSPVDRRRALNLLALGQGLTSPLLSKVQPVDLH